MDLISLLFGVKDNTVSCLKFRQGRAVPTCLHLDASRSKFIELSKFLNLKLRNWHLRDQSGHFFISFCCGRTLINVSEFECINNENIQKKKEKHEYLNYMVKPTHYVKTEITCYHRFIISFSIINYNRRFKVICQILIP